MDDFSPTPVPPSLDRAEEEVFQESLVEDKQVAAPYFHAAWAKVEEDYLNEIEKCRKPISAELIAEEYKIEGIARERYADFLTSQLKKVQDAVSAIESVERTNGNPGGN